MFSCYSSFYTFSSFAILSNPILSYPIIDILQYSIIISTRKVLFCVMFSDCLRNCTFTLTFRYKSMNINNTLSWNIYYILEYFLHIFLFLPPILSTYISYYVNLESKIPKICWIEHCTLLITHVHSLLFWSVAFLSHFYPNLVFFLIVFFYFVLFYFALFCFFFKAIWINMKHIISM